MHHNHHNLDSTEIMLHRKEQLRSGLEIFSKYRSNRDYKSKPTFFDDVDIKNRMTYTVENTSMILVE